MTQRNGWSGRRWLAFGVMLTLIPIIVIAGRGRRALIDGSDTEWKPLGDMALNLIDDKFAPDTGQDPPDNILLPMTLHIGNGTYKRLWVNENGFVSLTEEVGTEPPTETQLADAGSLAEIPGNVIAVFYADVVSRTPVAPCDHPRSQQCSDITWATVNMTEQEIAEFGQPPPSVTRGARVTWGDESTGPSPFGVVVREGAASIDDNKRGGFQIRLIDRSDPLQPPTLGDFDLELNYNGIPWDVGIIGIKAGGVELDFARFYASFASSNPQFALNENDPDHPCIHASDVDPSFDPNVPFICNNITVSFRNGVPDLQTYSADVSGAVDAPATASANAGDPFSFDVTINNNDYDEATHLTTKMDLPTGWSFVSASPGTVCTQTGLELSCNHGSLLPNGSVKPRLTLRSLVAQPSTPSLLRFSADQFDPVPANNGGSLAVSINPTADLSVTGCSGPTSVARGTPVSITCTVRNDGPQSATHIVLTAQLNSVLTFQSGTDCSPSAANVTCLRGSIPANSTAEFSMTLNTASAGSANIGLSVVGDEHEPAEANNTRNVSVSITEPKGKSGGGSGSLLMLLLVGLLPWQRHLDFGLKHS